MTQNYWFIKAKTTEELENENRAFYDVTISQLMKIMNTTANVVHVENLSERIKANRDYMLRTIRGSKILNL